MDGWAFLQESDPDAKELMVNVMKIAFETRRLMDRKLANEIAVGLGKLFGGK